MRGGGDCAVAATPSQPGPAGVSRGAGRAQQDAREIHDTLAQGYVGISVQLELLAELLRQRKLDDAGKHLDKTRDYVREGLADARQSIWALRTQDADETTLPVTHGRLDLGPWQRVFYAEFDGQRRKRVIVKVLGVE